LTSDESLVFEQIWPAVKSDLNACVRVGVRVCVRARVRVWVCVCVELCGSVLNSP